jgi:hypothetical protein
MTVKTARRLGWVALFGATLLGNPTSALAQTTCDARNMPGVRDPQAVTRFLTGVRNDGGVRVGRVSYLNYNALAPRLKSITLAGFQRMEVRIGEPATARAAEFVTASYFDVLGVQMQAGRAFAIGKDEPNDRALEAVISHALWTSMFDAQPSAVGRTLAVNGRLVTVVGVAGPDFRGVDARMPISIWFPGVSLPVLTESPGLRTDDRATGGYYEFVARQTSGTTWADASRELTSATRWLLEQYPAENAKFTDVGFHSADAVFGCAGR